MAESATAKVLRPANTLKEKVTGGDPNVKIGFDEAMVERAEGAIREMGDAYEEDLLNEIGSLTLLYEGALADRPRRPGFLADVVKRCHEIRGEGGTFGFPLVSEFANRLYDFASNPSRVEDVHMEIIKAHIDAIQVVVAGKLKDDGGDMGRELKTMLNVAIEKRG